MHKTWVEEIVEALEYHNGKAHLDDIFEYIKDNTSRDLSVLKHPKAHIRNAIERFSSDSEAFNGYVDLFYSVYGKGHGVWGLRSMCGDEQNNLKVSKKQEVISNLHKLLEQEDLKKEKKESMEELINLITKYIR